MSDATTGAPEPRVVEAGRGVGWWGDTWALFIRSAEHLFRMGKK